MTEKKLKYKESLEQYPNCPPEDYQEVEREAFRWTHNPFTDNDFKPLNVIVIDEPPQRMLGGSGQNVLRLWLIPV
jgi:hypothetical protein